MGSLTMSRVSRQIPTLFLFFLSATSFYYFTYLYIKKGRHPRQQPSNPYGTWVQASSTPLDSFFRTLCLETQVAYRFSGCLPLVYPLDIFPFPSHTFSISRNSHLSLCFNPSRSLAHNIPNSPYCLR